jgi:chromosome segregation ATPase
MDALRGVLERASVCAQAEQRSQAGSTNASPSSSVTLHEEEQSTPLEERIAELEQEIDDLRGGNNRQQDYISFTRQDLEDTNRQLDMEREANRELQDELEDVRQQLRARVEQLDRARNIIRTQDLAPQFDTNFQQEQETRELREENRRLQRQNESLRGDNESHRRELDDLANVREAHASGVRDLLQEMTQIRVQRDEARTELQEMTEAYNTMRKGVEEERFRSEDLAAENQRMRAQLDEERTRSRDLTADNQTVRTELDATRTASRIWEENFRAVNDAAVEFSDQCMQNQQELLRLRTEVQNQEGQIQALRAEHDHLDRLHQRRQGIAQDFAQLSVRFNDIREQVKRLQAEVQTQNARIAQLEHANRMNHMSRPLSESEMRKRRRGE